ncbi:MAG TPA: tRNA lysidine(34) synthetase TilS [Gemmatimonadales bacterium]|nr:tRNA lysidine(34) synthetase TilS [Gemmatimonadales bacterium]
MPLLAPFLQHLAGFNLGRSRAVVAVSGGADSLVLLDLMARGRDEHGLDLIVAHADHGIHSESGGVADQVAAAATALNLPFEIGRLALGSSATETAAREARYGWLESVRHQAGADWIVTAHHSDDQAETVLMRLLRGSGPAGLAAMADREGLLIRPLLPFTRAQLAEHAAARAIEGWHDPANHDSRFLRSWLRHEVLPTLRERLPEVDRDLLRAGRQAALDREAWDQLLDQTPELDWRSESGGASLAVEGLLAWDGPLALRLLSAAGRRVGAILGPTRAGRILTLARKGASGAVVELGGGWRAERAFDRVRLVRETDAPTAASLTIEGSTGSAIWGVEWVLDWWGERAPPKQERDGLSAWFIPEPMTVRRWVAGERIQPLRGRGHRLLARCFQDARVPRSRRERWPVFEAGGRLVWVPGVCRSADRMPEPGQPALRVEARGR